MNGRWGCADGGADPGRLRRVGSRRRRETGLAGGAGGARGGRGFRSAGSVDGPVPKRHGGGRRHLACVDGRRMDESMTDADLHLAQDMPRRPGWRSACFAFAASAALERCTVLRSGRGAGGGAFWLGGNRPLAWGGERRPVRRRRAAARPRDSPVPPRRAGGRGVADQAPPFWPFSSSAAGACCSSRISCRPAIRIRSGRWAREDARPRFFPARSAFRATPARRRSCVCHLRRGVLGGALQLCRSGRNAQALVAGAGR